MSVSLEAGLWLEDRNACLAWGATLDELRAAVPPDFWVVTQWSPPTDQLYWNGRVWGGLRCQVVTSFGDPYWPQSDPRWPQVALQGLRLVFWPPGGERSSAEEFRWLQPELVERFGPPESLRDDGADGEALWHVGGVTVRHEYYDGFGGGHFVFVFRTWS